MVSVIGLQSHVVRTCDLFVLFMYDAFKFPVFTVLQPT